MSRSCPSKQAIMRGFRPQSPSHQQKVFCGVCSSRCIFCDIWKLAVLVTSRIPLTSKYGSSKSSCLTKHHSRSSSASSTSSSSSATEVFDWEASERMIEAQFQTQRVRLASIMSICTVDGAEECEGLHVAYDRCLGSVQELLYQERVLENTIIRSRMYSSRSSDISLDCRNNTAYYETSRRPSRVGLTAWWKRRIGCQLKI